MRPNDDIKDHIIFNCVFLKLWNLVSFCMILIKKNTFRYHLRNSSKIIQTLQRVANEKLN